ncbi:UNVERIFIED_CONTAM: hypothetical protein RF648_22020, partial [Kocuria sp. CPCC 205274]
LWTNVIERSYSDKFQERYPTYKGCSVAPRWHNYQNFYKDVQSLPGFKEWLDTKNKMCLDKDTRIEGNKIYSLETCLFIPQFENISKASRNRVYKPNTERPF